MSTLQKAMVLLDIVRDHLQDACHGRDDIQDAIDDIGKSSCYSRRLFQVAQLGSHNGARR